MRIKRVNEWVDYDKDEYEWDEDNKSPHYDLMKLFSEFHDSSDLMKYKPIQFLKSLNLTGTQYKKLANLIEIYGAEKYNEGIDKGFYQASTD